MFPRMAVVVCLFCAASTFAGEEDPDPYAPEDLIRYIRAEDTLGVLSTLSRHPNSVRGVVRNSPLAVAIHCGRVDYVHWLLIMKADPNHGVYFNNVKPLELAVWQDNLEMMRLLLAHGATMQPYWKDGSQTHELNAAVASGYVEITSCLLERRGEFGAYVYNPLEMALMNGHLDTAQLAWSKNRGRSVWAAAALNEVEYVANALRSNPDLLKAKHIETETSLLSWAAMGIGTDVADYLLASKMPLKSDFGQAPIFMCGSIAMAKWFEHQGVAMPKTEVGQFGMQVSALRLGNGALLRWYVRERHLDPNAKDEGKSVLHVAVAENRFDMVVALLALGADPNIQDRQGRSPLHLASHYAYDQIQRALLAAGARTDLRDNERQTPLHLVAGFDLEWGVRAIELKKGRHACARALLKAGASPHALNRAGQSSRAMALDKGRDDLVELFDLYEGVTPRR